jgi:hypothetical protein
MRSKLLVVAAFFTLLFPNTMALSRELHFMSDGQEYAYLTDLNRVYRYSEEDGEWRRQKSTVRLVQCLRQPYGCEIAEVFDDGSSEDLGPVILMNGRMVPLGMLEPVPTFPPPPPPGHVQRFPPWGLGPWGPTPRVYPPAFAQGHAPAPFLSPGVGGPVPQGPGGDGKQVLGGNLPSCGGLFAGKGPQTAPKDPVTGAPLCKPF